MMDDITFDYGKLLGRIKERFGPQHLFAQALGISRGSLNLRLNNKMEFSQHEIFKSCDLLGIPYEEIPIYFFKLAV